jgi:hypothetical protein
VNAKPPVIPIEVLPAETSRAESDDRSSSAASSHPVPFHPLAVTLMLLVDNLWNLADWLIIDWIFTIPLSFITVFIPALAIQRGIQRDGWSAAFAKALFLAIVAAVPTSITGTPIGLALLAWAGIRRLRQ